MLVTYFRSSSYNRWDWCPHAYFIEYVLGLKGPANQKADLGSITHKALELLARKKKAIQDGVKTFVEPESESAFNIDEVTPDFAVDWAFHFYTKVKKTLWKWGHKDLVKIREMTWTVLNHKNGMFNPLKREIVEPEQYFDFTIDEPWAKYSYTLPDGKVITGQLAVKGTVDLVTRVKPGVLEYVDYKTGKRIDWATGEEKTYKKLCKDPQLLLYNYALQRLFPNDFILMTIYFIQFGGPFSPYMGEDPSRACLDMLRKRFEMVRDCVRPKLNKTWKCSKLCHYGKTIQPGTNQTMCQFMNRELMTLGMDRVVAKHGNLSNLSSYGEGGGVSDRDGKST